MGDIADMHVAAYEAGLDPNEMDGADWADFYDAENDSGFPPNPWLIWHEAVSFIEWLGREAEEQKIEPVEVLRLYFPDIPDHAGALAGLRAIAAHSDPEPAEKD